MNVEEATREAYKLSGKDVDKFNKKMLLEYKSILSDTQDKISKTYSKYLDNVDGNEYLFEMSKGNRLTELNKSVEKIITKSQKKIDAFIIKGSETAFTSNYYRTQYLANFIVDKKIFKAVNKDQLKASVAGNIEGIKDIKVLQFTPKYGRLEDILNKNNKAASARIKLLIEESIAQGLNSKELNDKIAKQFNIAASNSMRVSRTEVNRNLNSGAFATNLLLKDNGIITKRQIVSKLDSVTREQSVLVNNQIEDDNGYFTYPNGLLVKVPGNSGVLAYDVNDREVVIDVVINSTPSTAIGINPSTGNRTNISFRNYNTWLKNKGK